MLKKTQILFLLSLIAFSPCLVLATNGESTDGPSPYPTEAWSLQDIVDLVGTLRDFVLVVGIILVVIFLVWSGITFLGAQGNPEKIQQAKTRFIWTLVGAAVILATFAILATIKGFIAQDWL